MMTISTIITVTQLLTSLPTGLLRIYHAGTLVRSRLTSDCQNKADDEQKAKYGYNDNLGHRFFFCTRALFDVLLITHFPKISLI